MLNTEPDIRNAHRTPKLREVYNIVQDHGPYGIKGNEAVDKVMKEIIGMSGAATTPIWSQPLYRKGGEYT